MMIPAFEKLSSSKFRARFTLKAEEREYARLKGDKILRGHAKDFIRTRLAPANPPRDGKQTPYRGHPVFIAQHATATCCPSCLQKWYGISKGRPLTEFEIEKIAGMILGWIGRQIGKQTFSI